MAAVPWEVDDTIAGVPWEVDDTKPKARPALTPLAKARAKDEVGRLDQFGLGVAEQAIAAGAGINSLLKKVGWGTDKLPSQEELTALRNYNEGSGYATAGNVAGGVAGMLLPGAMAAKLGKGALAADALLSAGEGYLTADEGKRGQGAALGTGGSVAGSALGSLAGRIVSPVGKITPAAQKLMDKGVRLTPGQAGSDTAHTVEGYLAKVPFVGSTVRARQAEGAGNLVAGLGREMDVKIPADATAREAAQLIEDSVHAKYTAAVTTPKLAQYQQFTAPQATDIAGILKHIPDSDARTTSNILKAFTNGQDFIRSAPSSRVAGDKWKEIDTYLGAQGAGFAPIKDLWRKSFADIAGPEATTKLMDANLSHRASLAVRKALGQRDAPTALQLVQALRKHDLDPAAIAADAGKYIPDTSNLSAKARAINEFGELGHDIANKNIAPWVIPQVAAALGLGSMYGSAGAVLPVAAGAALGTQAAYTKPMQRYMTGQLGKTQRAVAKSLREGAGKNVARRTLSELAQENE